MPQRRSTEHNIGAIGIKNLIHTRRLAGRAQFCASRDHGNFQRLKHRNFAQTRSGHHPKIFRPELMACLKNFCALLHIFASRAGIGPGSERACNLEPAFFDTNILLQHHRIGPIGQRRAREDAQCLARQKLPCEGFSRS
jgi:hypothetical protein